MHTCLDLSDLSLWDLTLELDVAAAAAAVHPGPSSSSTALSSGAGSTSVGSRESTASRDTEPGWCLAWCPDRLVGEVVAVALGGKAGEKGAVKVSYRNDAPETLS